MLRLEGLFDASSGWMTWFKQCHVIREIRVHGKKLSCDKQAAEDFKTEFTEFIQSQDISNEQVYNADESGLFSKCLPMCTLAFEREHKTSGYKSSKEHLAIMMCSNATGTHKLKLVITLDFRI